MAPRTDLHFHTQYQLERLRQTILQHDQITEENKDLILRFYAQCQAEALSNARLAKTLWIMRNLGIWMGKKSFATAGKDDIVQLVNRIQAQYANYWTVLDYKAMLKKFYRTMLSDGYHSPDSVMWIRLGRGKQRRINPAHILSDEDVIRLIQAQDMLNHVWSRVRNKAMIAFLYDSGVRIGEFLSMTIQDLRVTTDLWHVTVRGKTGQRTFPIFTSIPYLKEYLDIHPRRSVSEAPLWCSYHDATRSISYEKVTKSLRRAFKRAAVARPANPHNFRKSACSRDSAFMSDQQLKRKYGWTPDSKELRTYSHLRLEDLDNSLRQRYGLVSASPQESAVLTKPCPFCSTENKPDGQFCSTCKRPLLLKGALQEEERKAALDSLLVELLTSLAETHPDVKEKFRRLVQQRNLQALFQRHAASPAG